MSGKHSMQQSLFPVHVQPQQPQLPCKQKEYITHPHMYIYIYIHTYLYTCIYIYIEKRERNRCRQGIPSFGRKLIYQIHLYQNLTAEFQLVSPESPR